MSSRHRIEVALGDFEVPLHQLGLGVAVDLDHETVDRLLVIQTRRAVPGTVQIAAHKGIVGIRRRPIDRVLEQGHADPVHFVGRFGLAVEQGAFPIEAEAFAAQTAQISGGDVFDLDLPIAEIGETVVLNLDR